jgi:hypothetical protein
LDLEEGEDQEEKDGEERKTAINTKLREKERRHFEQQRLQQLQRQKHEAEMLAKVRRMGKCQAGFEWEKVPGGYRCSAGSHFVSDSDPALHA